MYILSILPLINWFKTSLFNKKMRFACAGSGAWATGLAPRSRSVRSRSSGWTNTHDCINNLSFFSPNTIILGYSLKKIAIHLMFILTACYSKAIAFISEDIMILLVCYLSTSKVISHKWNQFLLSFRENKKVFRTQRIITNLVHPDFLSTNLTAFGKHLRITTAFPSTNIR